MKQPTQVIEAPHRVIGAVENPHEVVRRRRINPIRAALILSIVFAAGYAAFQRIGTTANADVVEFTRNLAGGFLALGMTEDQPGFMALSALDRGEVQVRADRTSNTLAGTHTVVEVETPRGTTRTRLRGPQIMLISEAGAVERYPVDWTLAEFDALRAAADCSHEEALKKHRCGAPFTELQEAFATWPADRVPDPVRSFLEPFTDRRTRH